MNSPRQMQNSELNNKVLCCCYLVQQYIIELGESGKKLEDIAHNEKDLETLGVPVVDTTAKDVENTLDDEGKMTRKVEKGPVIKSAKLPKDIKSIKQLQEINNRNKLNAKKEKEDEHEI